MNNQTTIGILGSGTWGIALARLQGNTSRLVERFTEHALRFSTAPDVAPPSAAEPPTS